eukprot:13867091-Alexandrium_andersonii.AAC.1
MSRMYDARVYRVSGWCADTPAPGAAAPRRGHYVRPTDVRAPARNGGPRAVSAVLPEQLSRTAAGAPRGAP